MPKPLPIDLYPIVALGMAPAPPDVGSGKFRPDQTLRDMAMSRLQASFARGDLWRAGYALPNAEPSGTAALDKRLPGGGWPLGRLTELFVDRPGIGELQLALPMLARMTQAGRHIAFIDPPHVPYVHALIQAGLEPACTLVVEPPTGNERGRQAIWAAEQLLRTQVYGAVLAWAPGLREADSRRLQLAAETNGSIGLIYRPARAAGMPSVAALRLRLARCNGRLEIEILKVRGGRAGARFFADEDAPGSTVAALPLKSGSVA